MMTWEKMLSESVRDAETLRNLLQLTEEDAKQMSDIVAKYPVCVNPYYLGLVDMANADDPIRKMCIPDIREFSEGGFKDTSGEADNTVIKGMQHKYKQTVLILSTNQCAMYCRHCFRKRMVGMSSEEVANELPLMAEYVRNHSEVNNVLISGGDAFMNSAELLERYLMYFTDIPTVDFIRFGTRIPVVLPQRIIEDEKLLWMLEKYGKKKQIIVVTQFNHPRELTPESVEAVRLLRETGCIVRNQTVLLKGVNNHPEVMAELMNRLVACGIIPYYIFQCRPVEGVQNQFQVPILEGMDIIDEAKKYMNGQSKSVRYVMSHATGKIEMIGKDQNGQVIFRYHQAKYDKDPSRVFSVNLEHSQCWLKGIPS